MEYRFFLSQSQPAELKVQGGALTLTHTVDHQAVDLVFRAPEGQVDFARLTVRKSFLP